MIISPDGAQGSLKVRQDARVFAGLIDGKESATLELATDRYAYVHVARGRVELNGVPIESGHIYEFCVRGLAPEALC